jgi:hypothetical protein
MSKSHPIFHFALYIFIIFLCINILPYIIMNDLKNEKIKLMALGLQANYTDWSGRPLSSKLVLTFAGRRASCGQRSSSPWPLISVI